MSITAGTLTSLHTSGRSAWYRCAAQLLIVQLVCVPLLATAEAPASTDDDGNWASEVKRSPDAWLRRMNRSFSELDYDGLFSFYGGSDMASLRVVHQVSGGLRRERLVHLNGAPREIVREGEQVLCILQPGDKLVAVTGTIPAGPFARAFARDFSTIAHNYKLEMQGEDRIAARSAVRLHVEPRDEHRYGFRLWLDQETGFLLRSEMIDEHDNKPLEIFQFNQLLTGDDVDPAALQPERPRGSVIDHLIVASDQPQAPAATANRWRADWLPAGFEMSTANVRQAPATSKNISALMYTDGLAAVSIFIEAMPVSGVSPMMSRKGATVSLTRHVAGPGNKQHLVTLVGEVPPDTATSIASSVSYHP